MSRRLRVGVLGLGVGRQHVRAFSGLPDLFEVAAVADPDAERLAKVAQRVEPARTVSDLDELLRTPDLDVIDVCTPPHLHVEHCSAVLNAGLHVICEKPIASSLAEVDVLEQAERASGRRFMPIFQYRFGAGLQKLRHLIDSGLAGRAYLSTVETAWSRGSDYYSVPWRGRWQTERGGVLLSHAIHAHDLLTYVSGPIRSVYARATTRVNPIETEDCAAASLELEDGSLATLAATLGSHTEISRLRFCFENLTAESSLSPYMPSADPWTLTPRDEATGERIDAALADFDPGREHYAGQFERFHAALEHDTELPVTLADARASLELVTALYHSASTGEPVELPLAKDHPRYRDWVNP